MMLTWSVVGAPQGPLLMVQRNTLVPVPSPVTVVLGAFGDVMVPLPLTRVQVPVAGATAALAASVALFVGRQSC